ncbi:LysR substrate-binding domain-containing protein [Roseovarius mucosus]|uniref:HTH-type transcriptional regulator YjiE n=1 Tax=Roseovarius mucosus TaxID=215743 RepID=A0A1V0RPJ2_9RHOB|nr:LysR substrate-binding domain-containing protein [Roseovarius mucosus]ARE83616.1 HTH-type transcriptional regulator YjiE [Roseovarius mucosus]|tara:strand:+ start:738 stop:1637 length:900 start_codon:yes stop_codon:yes gene_type:complete
MDLNIFDDVLVLLEEGNMSRAARRRNVTQPAFSRRIQSFENWLGRPIVKRAANRVEIEPALSENIVELQALIRHVEALRQRIAKYNAARSTVTVAAQHSLIVSIFPDFAAGARDAQPEVDFRLRAANHNDCISLFLSGEASLLMCYERDGGEPMPFDDRIVRATWGRDRLVPVIGGALRFTLDRKGAPPEDTPMIRYPSGSFFADMLAGASTSYSNHSGSTFAESAFTVGVKEMALMGFALAWLPMSLVYSEVQSGALIVCNGDTETLPLRISLFARPTDPVAMRLCSLRHDSVEPSRI